MCCAFQSKEGIEGLSRRLSLGFSGPNSSGPVQASSPFTSPRGTSPSIPEERRGGVIGSQNAFVLLMEKLRNKTLKSHMKKRAGSRGRAESRASSFSPCLQKAHFKAEIGALAIGFPSTFCVKQGCFILIPDTSLLIRSNPKKEQTHLFCLQWLAKFQTKPDPHHCGPNLQLWFYQGEGCIPCCENWSGLITRDWVAFWR